jgi:mannose-6-phosphate isomerase-like protein (cupin superfamily)/heme-degrading monooxygenase HmoA
MMNRLLLLLAALITIAESTQSQTKRVVHNDPAKYRELASVHAGAGKMGFTQIFGRNDLSTNLLYLHAGSINPKSGIGHHFHHTIEEMYVLLSGEAEFTVNGHTSKLKAPVIVPCKMGDAHAIYNPTGESLRWLNFGISSVKGQGDAFDLGDSRIGAKLDPVPSFVSSQLKKETLRTNNHLYASSGVLYRRVLGPEIFSTNWNHVDHLIIPAGKSIPQRKTEGIEEVYYVIKGTGKVTLAATSSDLKADDSFAALLGETISISNDGNADLELLVIGISAAQSKGPNALKPQAGPKAMALQMDFVVPKENAEAFEKMYSTVYVPAMTVQQGYVGSKLLRLFPEQLSKDIQAEPTTYNYQIQISFDTEENRRRWVASDQHKVAWPAASKLAKEFKWRGYDVMGDDNKQ